MPSRLDAERTLTSVSFRRLPNGLHNVAKQASFYVACWSDFGGFGNFGGEGFRALDGSQNQFLDVFLRCFFRVRVGIDFESFLEGSEAEK